MSTILKALQKLEQEKESDRPPRPTPVFSKPHSTTGGAAGWFSNPWARRAAMGLIFIVLSGTAIHFYRQSQSSPPHQGDHDAAMEKPAAVARAPREELTPSTAPPIAKQESIPAGGQSTVRSGQWTSAPQPPIPKTKSEAPEVDLNLQQPGRSAPSEGHRSQIQEHPRQAPMTSGDPVRHPNDAIQRPGPGEMPAAKIPTPPVVNGRKEIAPAKPAQETAGAAAMNAPSDAYENTPPLTDGRLKVHAIAWSPKVEERMAVVNNRVIYEGDSVDGFVVVAIRPDDVVVREKERGLWKVVFGKP